MESLFLKNGWCAWDATDSVEMSSGFDWKKAFHKLGILGISAMGSL